MVRQIVTANRLRDGLVVYLAKDDAWSEWITDGRVAASEEESAELVAIAERAVEQQVVIDPYLIDVSIEEGTVRPVRYRELIRARGPTDRPERGQAGA